MASPKVAEKALVAPRFLFRFEVQIRRCKSLWSPKGCQLDETYRLPTFAELDGDRTLADVRMAWSPEGLVWSVVVEDKQQQRWCRDSSLDDSDGLQVWVDTRATLNVHRASRFCHRYAFLPSGGGHGGKEPVADQLLINRARENARPVRPRELRVVSRISPTGYEMSAMIPAEALGGFDPEGQPRLGFTYALLDRERGLQTFSTGSEFPYEEDPSCWAIAELV